MKDEPVSSRSSVFVVVSKSGFKDFVAMLSLKNNK
jgi:hypothetical protein